MSCCPDTRVPALTPSPEYKGTGTNIELEGGRDGKTLKVYKIDGGDGSSKKAIVLIHDVFGGETGRHVGVADALAKENKCLVVMPDLYRGDPATPDMLGTPAFSEQVKRHLPSQMAADFDCLYKSLENVESIGLIGFCWGSWVVYHECIRLADNRIKAGANFHPSLGLEGMIGGNMVEMIPKNKIPQLIAPCKDDSPDMVSAMCAGLPGKDHNLIWFDVNHGFMTQGDVKDTLIKNRVDLGIQLATQFFDSKL